MRLLIIALFVFVCATAFLNTESAISSPNEQAAETAQKLSVNSNLEPEVSATAFGVFDVETGEMLFSKNVESELPIASIAKLFTAAEVLKAETVDEEVVVNSEDVAAEGRAGKLIAGQVYKLRDLIFPLLLESSNDAAEALERKLEEIPFADKVLADGSGLSSGNVATVKELSGEIRRVYQEAPHVFDVTTLKQYIGEHTGWINNSPVHDLPGYLGGKHGYTEAANRTLAAVFSEASLGGRELGYVILGSDDVRADVLELRSVVEDSVQIE